MSRRLFILAALCLVGCEAKSDMGEQPKYKPYAPNAAFADGASARPLPAGVVPRDPASVPGNAYPSVVSITPVGLPLTVAESAANPLPIDSALIDRGQRQFDVFCAACHGRLGNGMGMIAQRGLMHPPSLHTERLKRAGDGHFFNVVTAGYGAMYSYADKLTPQNRWAVVAYVRALQAGGDKATGQLADTLRGSGDAAAKTAGYRQ